MLLQSYKITRILPCSADPEKIRVITEVSGEIYGAFPYLNAILKGCIYNHPALTHSAAPRLRRELSQTLRPSGRWGKRRSGSTLSKPRHLFWGVEGLTLTIKKDGKLFTLHANHITLAKIEDENEAEEILKWLKGLINGTYENRDKIEPNYS